MILVFLGAPGCGKGTISKLFQENLNFCHISTGDLIRKEVSSGSELGKKLNQIITEGNLVDDEIVLSLLREKLKENTSDVILDGFPRNLSQAKKLDEIENINKVVYIDTPYEIIKERLCGRRTCQSCGNVYNINVQNVKNCECGGKLIQRDDDKPQVVDKRFEIYEKETMPLIEYYKNQNKLIKVLSKQSSVDTFDEIVKKLEIK